MRRMLFFICLVALVAVVVPSPSIEASCYGHCVADPAIPHCTWCYAAEEPTGTDCRQAKPCFCYEINCAEELDLGIGSIEPAQMVEPPQAVETASTEVTSTAK